MPEPITITVHGQPSHAMVRALRTLPVAAVLLALLAATGVSATVSPARQPASWYQIQMPGYGLCATATPSREVRLERCGHARQEWVMDHGQVILRGTRLALTVGHSWRMAVQPARWSRARWHWAADFGWLWDTKIHVCTGYCGHPVLTWIRAGHGAGTRLLIAEWNPYAYGLFQQFRWGAG